MTKMNIGRLEHLNITVGDIDATASVLCDLFGWRVRWAGSSIYDGRSVHVGGDDTYLALYCCADGQPRQAAQSSYDQKGGLNHIGVVVPDLDAVEAKVIAQGYEPNSHADYEPGRRFYFTQQDRFEIEVVQYE